MKKTLLAAMELTNQKEASEVSLLLTDDEEIQSLNKKYRNIDTPTDVLAFSQIEKVNSTPVLCDKEEFLLGDIVISVETAQRQAVELGHSLLYELILLSVHGFLHLLGFDHDYEKKNDKMKSLEKEIIDTVLINKN
ncbi:MAG: rRNA maturation RNase YbeY [Atribacterota bacterium]|jgi:probable rRNA maturation factor|nr:rRNA maturation RNase YbeY [Atribacterota bacterium]MDY0382287.1 rRNA maturation RNase YbeY [Atribacterota bacterium]